jgi:hypothetical protein
MGGHGVDRRRRAGGLVAGAALHVHVGSPVEKVSARSIIRIDVTSNVTLAEVPRVLLPEPQGDVVWCMSVVP